MKKIGSVREPTSGDTSRSLNWVHLADKVGRGLLCVVIAVMALFCLKTIYELRSGNQVRSDKSTRDVLANSSDEWLKLLGGNWQFADVPWTIRIRDLPQDAADRELNLPVPALLPIGNNESDSILPSGTEPKDGSTAYDSFASILKMLNATVSDQGDNVVYEVRNSAWKGFAYAPREAPHQVQLARIAFPGENGFWKYVDVAVAKQTLSYTSREIEFLLPLPLGSERMAIRRDDQGQVCAELMTLSMEFDRLCTFWSDAGWEVSREASQEVALASSDHQAKSDDNFPSPPEVSNMVLLCKRETETLLAIVSQVSKDAPRTLLVLRVP